MGRTIAIVLAALFLTSCEQRTVHKTTEKLASFDVAEPPSAEMGPTTGPRIAYSYTVSYAFDRPTVAQVQGDQLALCRRLGSRRCLVVRSTLHTPGPDEHVAADEAMLLVDARIVAGLNQRLDVLAKAGGARLTERQLTAEDVTRATIDADAKVRAKQALAERLLAIIRSGKGNVGELVQAERAYATTQEELDAARQEQASLARRVAMSSVTISYFYEDTPGARSAVWNSVRSAGDTLATSLAALISAVVAGLPWLVVGGGVILLLRRMARKRGWRRPGRRSPPPSPLGRDDTML